MPTLVTPTFYETRYFNLASGTFQKRIIQQRYVYLVSGFKSNGQPKSCSEHFTLDDGKLYRKNANVNTWSPSPISAGNYNVHVTDSNKPISDPQKTLNQYNCSNMQTVSSEKNKALKYPGQKKSSEIKLLPI